VILVRLAGVEFPVRKEMLVVTALTESTVFPVRRATLDLMVSQAPMDCPVVAERRATQARLAFVALPETRAAAPAASKASRVTRVETDCPVESAKRVCPV